MRMTILPYDKSWVTAFSTIQAALSAALTTVKVLSIEHVGSTSVPEMAAKPVIDIDIVVAEEDITAAIAALGLNGYTYHGETASLDQPLWTDIRFDTIITSATPKAPKSK